MVATSCCCLLLLCFCCCLRLASTGAARPPDAPAGTAPDSSATDEMLMLLNLSDDATSSLMPDYVIDDDDQIILYPTAALNELDTGPAKVRRQASDHEWRTAGLQLEHSQASSGGQFQPLRSRLQQFSPFESQQQQQQESLLSPSSQRARSPQAASQQPEDDENSPLAPNQKMGPKFTREPPSFIQYLNSSDLVIPCAASGQPAPSITWWHKSGGQLKLGSLLDKRYVRYDNALVISAFKAHEFEPEIHSTSYRCQAQNSLGTIISREVVINAVLDQEYEATVADQFVSADNDALFRCQVAPQMRDLFQVTGWLEDGQHLIATGSGSASSQPTSQTLASLFGLPVSSGQHALAWAHNSSRRRHQQQQPSSAVAGVGAAPAARAIMLPDGQLYLARVQLRDANKSYRCQIRNLLSGRTSFSAIGGRLFVTEASESGASPRIVEGPKSITVGKLQDQLLLTCLAQGSPRPTIRWFKWQAERASGGGGGGQSNEQLDSEAQEAFGQLEARQSHALGQWVELEPVNYTQNQVIKSQTNETLQQQQQRYLLSSENNFLLIKSLQLADQRARFKCLANNSFGAHQLETELRFDRWPGNKLLELHPKLEFISANSPELALGDAESAQASANRQLVFNCTIRAASSQPVLAVEWLRNGRQLFAIALDSLNQTLAQRQHLEPLVAPATAASLFDDANQELLVIEQPEANSSEQPATGAETHESPLGQESVAGQEPDQQQQQQQQSSFLAPLVSSSTLAKLTSERPNAWNTPSKRLGQSLRLLEADQLLYQLSIRGPPRRADRGSYQCRARTSRTTLEQTSQLLLRDTPPKFVHTFAGLLMQPNDKSQPASVSLKCVASGSPLPEISWSLSGFQVPESSRFRVGDYVTRDGLIVSFVNISQVQVEDGGLYECTATNDVGQLKHAAWLNVTGAAYVRPMPNVSAIAGGSLALMCPVGGWPIDQISWFKNATKLPANHRQKVFANGTLLISELNELLDGGHYSCQAKSAASSATSWARGETFASNQVSVTIKIPPVVEPFSFAKSLHRGQRYNIMCTVTRGDLPVSIRWSKDGQPISAPAALNQAELERNSLGQQDLYASAAAASGEPQNQLIQQRAGSARPPDSLEPVENNLMAGLAIKQLDPYSSTLTFASLQSYHRGLYSCEATNEVGRANQSSSLAIHVPPEWRIEPSDLSVTIGRTAVIDCQADGFPAARIEWRLSQDLFREPPSEFKPIISSLYMRVFENGSLIIYNTQRTDAGYYLCQANNGIGPGISRVIKLTVHVAAHFKSKIRTELVRRGQPARLRCEALGDLPIEISWLKDKLPLYYAQSDEPRYSLTKTLLQDGLLSELTIQESERADSARFTCITQNQFGSDDTNIQLLVQAPPDAPQEVRVSDVQARSAKLTWSPGHSGNSPLTKFVLMYAALGHANQQQQQQQQQQQLRQPAQFTNISLPANESSHVLQNLVPLSEYQFHLIAINSLGASQLPGEPTRFRTDDETPSLPPAMVKAQPLSAHSIRVRWRVPERRQHYGAISGFYVGYKLLRPSSGAAAAAASAADSGSALSAPSLTSAVTQAAAPPPSEPVKASDTFVYKTVEFSHNNGQLLGEFAAAAPANRTGQQQTSPASGYLEQECQLNSLRRGQKYLITVQPFNGRGAGPGSEPVVAETWRIDVPEAPSLRMVARTTHSIHLAWRVAKPIQAKRQNLLDERADEPPPPPPTLADSDKHKQRASQAARFLALKQPDQPKAPSLQQMDDALLLAAEELAAEEAQAMEPILGFLLTRKLLANLSGAPESQADTTEMRLPSDHMSQIIDHLNCGSRYQFTMAAINSVGVSAASEPLVVKTEGSAPVAPDRNSLLSLNSSSVVINLGAWHNGACPMRSFDILFKPSRSKKWTTLTNYQVAPPSWQQAAAAAAPATAAAPTTSTGAMSATPPTLTAAGEQHENQSRSLHVAASSTSQLAQRSSGARESDRRQQLQQQQQQQQQENATVVLDDLVSSVNYDLKILATNEAGTTEALYTFNTNGQTISSLNLDQQWTTGGEFQLGEASLGELFASTASLASLVPAVLLLLLVALSLSTGCILFSRRKHASSSNCSLSISSRSNQSSSNYCTAATTTNTATTTTTLGPASASACELKNGSGANFLHNLKFNQMDEQRKLANGETCLPDHPSSAIRLGDMRAGGQTAVPSELAAGANYAYFTPTMRQRASNNRSTASPQNGDLASVLNGSEAEMCLGASALNISGHGHAHHHHNHAPHHHQHQQQQQHSMTLNNKRPTFDQQEAEYYLATTSGANEPGAESPLLMVDQQQAANPKLVGQLAHLGKSSTLPSNCHQQIVQKLLIQQQQQQQQNQQLESRQQQALIETFVAANLMQQQQQQANEHEAQQVAAYASLQAALQAASNQQHQFAQTATHMSEQEAQSNLTQLLDQQVRQQVYATVKRGCPRPPNQQLYTTIYQCPAANDQVASSERQQMACCSGHHQHHQENGQMFCYHQAAGEPGADLQQECSQQQQQQQQTMSDYQQLRPLN